MKKHVTTQTFILAVASLALMLLIISLEGHLWHFGPEKTANGPSLSSLSETMPRYVEFEFSKRFPANNEAAGFNSCVIQDMYVSVKAIAEVEIPFALVPMFGKECKDNYGIPYRYTLLDADHMSYVNHSREFCAWIRSLGRTVEMTYEELIDSEEFNEISVALWNDDPVYRIRSCRFGNTTFIIKTSLRIHPPFDPDNPLDDVLKASDPQTI